MELLKLGAADYVTKPFDLDQLVDKVSALVRAAGGDAPPVLGISPTMRSLEASLPRIAAHATTLLITGESGSGKERVAQRLHELASGARECPFIAVNCGALSETLLEAELFGHEKGAFTGAARMKRGVFELAHGGTLFLDEVGDMSPAMQVKLLRALQERQFLRVGGEAPVRVDVRVICATHRDLRRMAAAGAFREDLFYRINVIALRVAPLRERREDILWLARRFLDDFAQQRGGPRRVLHPVAEQALLQYAWPGNVRELKHCIERACILSPAPLLSPEAFFDEEAGTVPACEVPAHTLNDYLAECERSFITHALESQHWQIGASADVLGISRKNLWEKMKKLGISAPE